MENENIVKIIGTITKPFEFNHEQFGETFYSTEMCVPRLSDTSDLIPIVVSEQLINLNDDVVGKKFEIEGNFRSYNKKNADSVRTNLILNVFVKRILEVDIDTPVKNEIELVGFIPKKPTYRRTPLGRDICDFILAVNRHSISRTLLKSDYLPCISWGRNASISETFEIGSKVHVIGRIQSRNYKKKIDAETSEDRVAYEVSSTSVKLVEPPKAKNADELESKVAATVD